jgi:hypothetical protein
MLIIRNKQNMMYPNHVIKIKSDIFTQRKTNASSGGFISGLPQSSKLSMLQITE